MPEVKVSIGGRDYEVFCQEGEQPFLHNAAALFDAEVQTLVEQMGRVPEARMLVMAGLVLADKTAGLDERLRAAEARAMECETELARARDSAEVEPERVEVPVVPELVMETLTDLAEQSEMLATRVEAQTGVRDED